MTLTNADWAEVAREVGVPDLPQHALPAPRFNIAPSQTHLVLAATQLGAVEWVTATWGFPSGKPGSLMINARAETAFSKPLFRDAFAHSRCVVVTDGFLEWRRTGNARDPVWFHRRGKGAIYMAGLLQNPTPSAPSQQFVVITTAANEDVAPTHNRMPAILLPQQVAAWLAAADTKLLRPAPQGYLDAVEVSSRVNNAAYDDPACLQGPLPLQRQLALF